MAHVYIQQKPTEDYNLLCLCYHYYLDLSLLNAERKFNGQTESNYLNISQV